MNAEMKTDSREATTVVKRVLVVDDDISILGVVSEVLEDDGYEVSTASSGEDAIDLLSGDPFALVMSDIRLPGINGIAVLEHVKAVSPATHVIMITSHGSLKTSIEAIQLGAYDYLLKPFENLSLISNSAKRAVDAHNSELERARLLRSLKESNTELERLNKIFHGLAIRDGLTDLYNHRHINEKLDDAVEKAIADATDLSLIFVDVDKFKTFNDLHGHQNGDVLLRELASLMRASVRKSDLVARWGGEEFVIACPGIDETQATDNAENLRKKIADHEFSVAAAQPASKITISAGVASLAKQKSKTALVEAADTALYKAKNSGRNRVCAAD